MITPLGMMLIRPPFSVTILSTDKIKLKDPSVLIFEAMGIVINAVPSVPTVNLPP